MSDELNLDGDAAAEGPPMEAEALAGLDAAARRAVLDAIEGLVEAECAGLPEPTRSCALQLPNDYGNAQRLLLRYGESLATTGDGDKARWYAFDGAKWDAVEGKAIARRWAHDAAKRIFDEAAGFSPRAPKASQKSAREKRVGWAMQSGNAGKITAMLSEAAPYVKRDPEDFDADPWRMAVANGTLILDRAAARRGDPVALEPHRREDLITRAAPVAYDPDAEAPRWERFLEEVLPEPEVRAFIQRFFGYCLTGSIEEQVMLFLWGQGSNGKSIIMEMMRIVLGLYNVGLPIDTFLHNERGKGGGDASPDLDRLPGARMVSSSEPDPGARLSESTIKRMTSGEKMQARPLFGAFYDFMPRFKAVISCNQRPKVRGTDNGTWRRILIVPFERVFVGDEIDKSLVAKLEAEKEGILRWLVAGFEMWAESGLAVPEKVSYATQQYRAESDPVQGFLEDCLQRVAPDEAETRRRQGLPPCTAQASTLFKIYEAWCRENGSEPKTLTGFGLALGDKGFEKKKVGGVNQYLNVRVVYDPRDMAEQAASGSAGGASGGGGEAAASSRRRGDPLAGMEGVDDEPPF
jgi:putative DNA primase/helicase